jgi:hypothetical protein
MDRARKTRQADWRPGFGQRKQAARIARGHASFLIREHTKNCNFIATALVDTGSRMDEVIFEEFWVLRRLLNPLPPVEAMELLIAYLEKSRNNAEFLVNMNQL